MGLDYKSKLKETIKHFQTGLAFMLPFLVIGAMGRIIPILFGHTSSTKDPFFGAMYMAGNIGFDLFVPILAGYIAYAIADTPGLAPGLVIGVIAKNGGSGYLGALLGGFLTGYAVYTIMQLSTKLPSIVRTTWDKFAPALVTIAVGLFVVMIINPPVKWVMDVTTAWLSGMSSTHYTMLGAVMGAIPGIDFGGPLSQAKYMFALGAFEKNILTPLAIVSATIAVPPVGLCLATIVKPNLFKEEIRKYGQTSIVYALFGGWTEIAIPFVVDDWWRVTASAIAGGAVAGGIAGSLMLQKMAPGGALLALPLYDRWWGYLLCLGTGSLVTMSLAILLKSIAKRPVEASE